MDALDLLREQHAHLDRQLAALEDGVDGRHAAAEALVDAVARHLYVEERHFGPVLRALSLDADADAGAEERRRLRAIMAEVAAADEHDFALQPALARLRAWLQAHAAAQEDRVFPRVAALTSDGVRRSLATTMLETIAELENEDWLGAPTDAEAWW